MARQIKLSTVLISLLITLILAGNNAWADYWTQVSGHGTGIDAYNYGGWGTLSLSHEDTGYYDGTDFDQILVNKTWANVGTGRMGAGLWGTTIVSPDAPQRRSGPYGTADTRIIDYFTVAAGQSGLQQGDPVQILFFAEVNGRIVLHGNPSGGSSTSYSAQLWRKFPYGILAELDYSTGGIYPPQDILVHDQLLEVVDVSIGETLYIDAMMDNTMNSSGHEPGTTQTNYLDIMPSCIARLGYAPGYENIEIISDANAPISIPKPDLVITDIWNDAGLIYYQIHNDSIVSCPAGHTTSLVVNATTIDSDTIGFLMLPGQREIRAFANYYWSCTPLDDTLTIVADIQQVIDENDEQNNSRTEVFLCDNNAPEIISGPTVSQITTQSAKISWTTDEDANSLVRYNTHADILADFAVDPTLTKEHELILNNLIPATTYIFSVSSTDESGNTTTGDNAYFTTQAVADNNDPEITFFAAVSPKFPMQFSIDTTDNIGVERVEFKIDGSLFEIDYSAPYTCILDPGRLGYTTSEFDGNHMVAAAVFDRSGNKSDTFVAAPYDFDCNRPACEIIEPEYGAAIDTDTEFAPYVNIPIDVCAYEFTGWTMGRARDFHGNPVMFQTSAPVYKVDFIHDGAIFDTTYGADVGEVHSSEFDANGLPLGTHTVWVRATSTEGCTASDLMHVTVRRRRPQLRLNSRTVTTSGTCLLVHLDFENTGDATAYVDSITDSHVGLHPRYWEYPDIDCVGSYEPSERRSTAEFTCDPCNVTLLPGAHYSFDYIVVPILYPGIEDYHLGLETIVSYHDNSESYSSTSRLPCTWVNPYSGRMNLEEAVAQCCRAADYLIATDPTNLYSLYDTNDVHILLSKAADLASVRTGVLGYYYSIGNTTSEYDRNDRIAVGDLLGDYRQELWLADNEDDRVRCYNSTGEYWISDGNLPHTVSGLHESDGFAFGNVYGSTLSGTPDPQNEFIVANGHDTFRFPYGDLGDVTWYSFDTAVSEFNRTEFHTDYEAGDGFAVGNVLPDASADEDEVLIAKTDGTIHIHQARSSSPALSIPTIFQSGDFFLTADILGDFKHEIVIGCKADETIYIYRGDDPAGLLLETITFYDLNSDDDIAAGDLTGDLKHEIAVADASADQILVYTYNTSSANMLRADLFNVEYYARDVLAVADFTHASKSEILILRGQNDHNRKTGQIEIISLDGGDTPGDRWALDDLIDEGGEWAQKLDPDWPREGYLLFVGETQVLPAFTVNHRLYYPEAGVHDRVYHIEATDRVYANTTEESYLPELAMGRIIGDSAARLTKLIQASLDVIRDERDFSNNFGFAASGHARGMSGEADDIDFVPERNSIADKLRDEGFTVSEAHEPDVTEFFAQANGRNAIYLGGHGSTWGWDDVNTTDVGAHFDPCGSTPLVYAASCLTGRYIDGYCLAESFLNNGAGAYIGATENGRGYPCFWLAEQFFDRFYVGRTIGSAFKHAKRAIQGSTSWWWDRGYERYNEAVFHLYGDPKLSLSSSVSMAAAETTDSPQLLDSEPPDFNGPLSSLQLSIPAFKVISSNGFDYVRIPGGDALLVPDMPEVPAYTVTIDFPPGCRVQDITMTQRGQLSSGIGLNINAVSTAVLQQQTSQEQQPPNGHDWYPERTFDWQTFDEPNDHTSLVVTVYPFYYNANTTQYMFYQSYDFDIDYTTSEITIMRLRTDKSVYSPGDTATVEAYLLNSSQQPTSVIAEAIITTSSGEPVYGWPIRTLNNLSGLASCSWSVDTTPADPNDYMARLTVRTTDANVLDTAAVPFRVGRALAQITDHSVNPQCWTENDQVTISTTLFNTGDIPITGTLYVEVQRTDGSLAAQYTTDFNDLPANNTVNSNVLWPPAIPRGQCTIIAYATYDARTTAVSIFPEVPLNYSGDLNNDGVVNLADYAILAALYQTADITADIAPIGGDCFVDLNDLYLLCSRWLETE